LTPSPALQIEGHRKKEEENRGGILKRGRLKRGELKRGGVFQLPFSVSGADRSQKIHSPIGGGARREKGVGAVSRADSLNKNKYPVKSTDLCKPPKWLC